MPYWPAAMDLKTAASYCGCCADTFRKVCPVKPVRITSSNRGERYLRHRLDEWLVSLDTNNKGNAPRKSMVELIYGGHGEGHRS